MSQAKYEKMTVAEKEGEDFISKKWRPMMAVTYMLTCLFDFIIGPVFFNLLQFYQEGQHIEMWQPLTLQGGGLFHLAMGVVLGITAYGRTQEKLNGVAGPISLLSQRQQYGSSQFQSSYDQGYNSTYNYPTRNPQQNYRQSTIQTGIINNKFGKVVPQDDEDPIL